MRPRNRPNQTEVLTPAVIVLGAQWGDGGKRKAIDQLGQHADLIVKLNGGNNAGCTAVIDGEKYALCLPSAGILSEGVIPIIDNGVVVDPDILFEELADITARGVDCSRLSVSSNAHIIPPYNRPMDQANERARGNNLIGTTGQGIGPTYVDKMNRTGLCIQDLSHPEELRVKVEVVLAPRNIIFEAVDLGVLDPIEVSDHLLSSADRIKPMLCDVSLVVNDALDCGDIALFEGGQATMFDIDHGTYLFVTSPSPITSGALTDSDVGPTRIDCVVGVAKVYTTRVSEGPFPTELDNEVGEAPRTRGGEFGVTTDCPRRTGWFDVVIMRYSTRVNGLVDIRLTRLDVLPGYEMIPVCAAYEVDGVRIREMFLDQVGLEVTTPAYEELPGWSEDIPQCRFLDEPPQAAQDYIKRLEELSRCRIQSIGVDPGREATIARCPLV